MNSGTDLDLGAFDQGLAVRYVFQSWNDGGAIDHHVKAPKFPVTYTATFKPSYQLTTVDSPAAGGTIAVPPSFLHGSFSGGSSDFFYAGKVVAITATPSSGFAFVGWTGNVANASNPSTTVTMPAGSLTVTAKFAALVAVPNVVGQTNAAASSAITTAGLVAGSITAAHSNTVASGSVISQTPAAGTKVVTGSAVNLVISTGPPGNVVPTVVSVNVLFGSIAYKVTPSSRTRLPWQINGIRVVFSEPISSGGAASLGGAAVTGFQGLGTNTLTWTLTPIPLGKPVIVLSGSGASALKDAAGKALNAGAGFNQTLKILWGDFNDDGGVNASDLARVNSARTAPYNIFADMNGDGVVDLNDVQIVRTRAGTSLP